MLIAGGSSWCPGSCAACDGVLCKKGRKGITNKLLQLTKTVARMAEWEGRFVVQFCKVFHQSKPSRRSEWPRECPCSCPSPCSCPWLCPCSSAWDDFGKNE
eukprot:767700-Hanusia_phi.AAC.4